MTGHLHRDAEDLPDDAGPPPREPGAGWAADAGQQLTRCPLILVIWTDFPTPTPP